MNLYLISQKENNDWDTFDSAVVCATTEIAAQKIHPGGYDEESWSTENWCAQENVKVKYLGIADDSLKTGIVCASYNAG